MRVMKQDEEYEEDEMLDEEGEEEYDYDEEGEEDTDAPIETLYGIPKKYIVIGGAVILVVVIAVFVFSTMKKSEKAEEVYIPPQPVATEPVETEPLEQTTYEDGDVGPNGLVWDGVSQSWTDQATWDANHASPTLEELSSEDEILLRKMGYTGDEIQLCLENGFSVAALVEAAQELHDEEAKEALVRMSDHASEEFRYIIDNTYFSQPPFTFENQLDLDLEEANYYDGQFTVNADYKKCPSYGAQLQLKCKVSNNCYVWYIVTPRRWETLPEEGNIVLTLDYVVWGSYAYITKVQEVDPNLATIDASVNDSISENISNSSNGEVVTEDPVETEEFTEDDEIINNDIVIEEEVAEE